MSRVLSLFGLVLALGTMVAVRPERPPAEADVRLAAGSLSQSNSRDGSAILSASDIKPGQVHSGTVTIGNTGDTTGTFGLTQVTTGETPGVGGAQLSSRLQLLVQDVTSTASPVTIYSGPLSGLGVVELGDFAAGSARDYRFSVVLPDTGNDSDVAGGSVTVRFDWLADADGSGPEDPGPAPDPPAQPPPTVTLPTPPSPGPSAPADKVPPKVRLSGKAKQKLVRQKAILLTAQCDETCTFTATASGLRKVKLPVVRGSGASGAKTRIRIRLRKAALKAARRAKRVTVTVRALDAAGNATTAKLKLKVAR